VIDGDCECGHPFDPHILVCYDNDDPMGGGLMFCQELGTCDCVRTWDVPQSGRPRRNIMPPPHVVEEWRQALREAGNGG